MPLFLGVDGGQSTTTAIIGDESGRVLGTGVGGPCNHVGATEGAPKLKRTVQECLAKACEQAGLDPAAVHFRAACFGMSGGPADKEALLAETIRADRLIVTHDGLIALSGAMEGKPGIIVIAGTGSLAFGRNAAGRTARAGGWGYIFGDEGGGLNIVRQAVRALLRHDEGWGPETALRTAMLHATHTVNANDLLHLLYTAEWPRSRVAKLAKLVDDIAVGGDPTAREILHQAAEHLASWALAVRTQLWNPGDPVHIAYIGGVFQSQILLDHFRSLVQQDNATCGPPLLGPAAGALLEAYRGAAEVGQAVPPALFANLKVSMPKLSIRDLHLVNKRLFIRVDYNVPLAAGGQEITSDQRIQASLPTLRYALEHGAGLILASHLGRPKGKPNPELSLKPIASRLQELLQRPIKMAPDCIGPQVEDLKPNPGEILLLENLRFHPEEEKNDPQFSKQLASLCDLYVNDAFGAAHRAHASTVGMIAFVPQAAAGLLMEKELKYLTLATQNPPRPCISILGGAKVSDKIEVISNLAKIVDRLLIGGAMAYTFLKSQGHPTGKSLVEDDKLDLARKLLADFGAKIMLPTDHVVAAEFKENAASQVVEEIPGGMMGMDIGPETIAAFSEVIGSAKTIIWNGPMGVFEKPPFDKGTVAIAKAVANSGAVSIVGGGDSEKAVQSAGVAGKISHISTGGGASLEFLAGIELPGVAALTEQETRGEVGRAVPPAHS